ncbi:MAG TPA: F0F1 ATP synthase subunit delta [Burkholderiaceae bacterium]|nr:F0F1 ATP synthase subunit delta [Burkholderiaceae bacterium]
MAELATIARPYAEALFKAVSASEAPALSQQMNALAVVAEDDRLREFADNPKTQGQQVFDVIAAAVGGALDAKIGNLLHAVIDNGRLAALPEMAAQFQALVNARSGVSDATIESAFEIDAAQLAQVVATLEKRFGRKLEARVVVVPELIGGIRAIVGDEVLDTSVRARLEQMKVALTA